MRQVVNYQLGPAKLDPMTSPLGERRALMNENRTLSVRQVFLLTVGELYSSLEDSEVLSDVQEFLIAITGSFMGEVGYRHVRNAVAETDRD